EAASALIEVGSVDRVESALAAMPFEERGRLIPAMVPLLAGARAEGREALFVLRRQATTDVATKSVDAQLLPALENERRAGRAGRAHAGRGPEGPDPVVVRPQDRRRPRRQTGGARTDADAGPGLRRRRGPPGTGEDDRIVARSRLPLPHLRGRGEGRRQGHPPRAGGLPREGRLRCGGPARAPGGPAD